MSRTTQIPHEQLTAYFDAYTKRFLRDGSPEAVDVEVSPLQLGDQQMADGAHLTGITFDPDTKTLELALDSGDHRVYEPREVWAVEEANGSLSALEIMAKDGSLEVVEIKAVGLRRLS